VTLRASRFATLRRALANIETIGAQPCYPPGIMMKQERLIMCDYSLHNVASRPAKVETS